MVERSYRLPCPSCHGTGYRIRPYQSLANEAFVLNRVRNQLARRGITTCAQARYALPQLATEGALGHMMMQTLEQALYSPNLKALRRLFPDDPTIGTAATEEEGECE